MNDELLELGQWALARAKGAGADDCRVRIGRQRFVEIRYRDRKPETIREAVERSLNIEIFARGRYSSQATSDLRRDALDAFIADAVETTRLLAEDLYRTLPDPAYYEGRAETDLEISDAARAEVDPQERRDMARAIEDACIEAGGEKVVSVTAGCQETREESLMLSSNRFTGWEESTLFGGGAMMTAKDEGARRPAGYHFVACRRRGDVPEARALGAEAARRALDLVGARKLGTERLPVIVENRDAGRLLGGLLSAMSGRNVQQKQSFLAASRGARIGSEKLTLIDDPLVARGLGSRLYDRDGLTARRRTMVEAGVLREFYVDWYYSRKLGWEPTTGGASNLVLPPGTRAVGEIMRDLGRGILVTGFIGGNANATTGDFSVGITGKLFEGGLPVQPVAEMNIAGNHKELWSRLAEVADDPWPYSSVRAPSLVFADVVVAGS